MTNLKGPGSPSAASHGVLGLRVTKDEIWSLNGFIKLAKNVVSWRKYTKARRGVEMKVLMRHQPAKSTRLFNGISLSDQEKKPSDNLELASSMQADA